MKRYGLRDDQFARIEALLPGRPGTVGRNSELGNRLFVEAVIWKFRSGAPWRDLPERFGDWKNIHKRFSRWAASGVESLFKTLADDPDNEYAMIDATIVRVRYQFLRCLLAGIADSNAARERQHGLLTFVVGDVHGCFDKLQAFSNFATRLAPGSRLGMFWLETTSIEVRIAGRWSTFSCINSSVGPANSSAFVETTSRC
jgi:transposase